MVLKRNFEVLADKFNLAGIYMNRNYGYKWASDLYECWFIVL
jgi:uncharacterized membrane protein